MDKTISPLISKKFCARIFNKKNLVEFKDATKPFAPDEELIHVDNGLQTPVKFKKCIIENDKLKYCVESKGEILSIDNKKNLQRKDYLDIADIPVHPAAYKKMMEN